MKLFHAKCKFCEFEFPTPELFHISGPPEFFGLWCKSCELIVHNYFAVKEWIAKNES